MKGRVIGASYAATISSIRSGMKPSLMLLRYNRKAMSVMDMRMIHRAFITESCIEKRPPLRPGTRREGWVGCVIHLDRIPTLGKINLLPDGDLISFPDLHIWWERASTLLQLTYEQRGWIADVLRCVERLGHVFTLSAMYAFEQELSLLHPTNTHIRPKIRQILQQLRDMGLIRFNGNGVYQRLF